VLSYAKGGAIEMIQPERHQLQKQNYLALGLELHPVEWLFCAECLLLGCPLNRGLEEQKHMVKKSGAWDDGIEIAHTPMYQQRLGAIKNLLS
jgi:hypothetical protein